MNFKICPRTLSAPCTFNLRFVEFKQVLVKIKVKGQNIDQNKGQNKDKSEHSN